MDSFTNKEQFDAGFSERLKPNDDAMPTILILNLMFYHPSVSNYFLLRDHYCFVCYYRLFDIYCDLNHMSIYEGCRLSNIHKC